MLTPSHGRAALYLFGYLQIHAFGCFHFCIHDCGAAHGAVSITLCASAASVDGVVLQRESLGSACLAR